MDKTWRLAHKHNFLKVNMKEDILLDIELVNIPIVDMSNVEDDSYDARLDDRRKRFCVVDTINLIKIFNNKASFQPIKGAISIDFSLDPCT